jgi:hypothetical protein
MFHTVMQYIIDGPLIEAPLDADIAYRRILPGFGNDDRLSFAADRAGSGAAAFVKHLDFDHGAFSVVEVCFV